jgi:hypothetical protein
MILTRHARRLADYQTKLNLIKDYRIEAQELSKLRLTVNPKEANKLTDTIDVLLETLNRLIET